MTKIHKCLRFVNHFELQVPVAGEVREILVDQNAMHRSEMSNCTPEFRMRILFRSFNCDLSLKKEILRTDRESIMTFDEWLVALIFGEHHYLLTTKNRTMEITSKVANAVNHEIVAGMAPESTHEGLIAGMEYGHR